MSAPTTSSELAVAIDERAVHVECADERNSRNQCINGRASGNERGSCIECCNEGTD
jgi:hypothetical protein